jgi:HSP20 family protein
VWENKNKENIKMRKNKLSLWDTSFGTLFFDSWFDPFYVPAKTGVKVSYFKDNEDLIFEATVPGYKKEDLSVDIKDGILTIGCEKSDNKRAASFSRSFILYDNKDLSEITEPTAELLDGILTVRLPDFYKVAENKNNQKKIEIK